MIGGYSPRLRRSASPVGNPGRAGPRACPTGWRDRIDSGENRRRRWLLGHPRRAGPPAALAAGRAVRGTGTAPPGAVRSGRPVPQTRGTATAEQPDEHLVVRYQHDGESVPVGDDEQQP
ncbi:hypothetical protein C5N14_08550 [Micromonospora sp. MW-13]|nr:hypothetical protein C5N14_08550 [Micromonospora sp. MW-13]